MSKKGEEMLRASVEDTFIKFATFNPTVESSQIQEHCKEFIKAVYTDLVVRMKANKREIEAQEKAIAQAGTQIIGGTRHE